MKKTSNMIMIVSSILILFTGISSVSALWNINLTASFAYEGTLALSKNLIIENPSSANNYVYSFDPEHVIQDSTAWTEFVKEYGTTTYVDTSGLWITQFAWDNSKLQINTDGRTSRNYMLWEIVSRYYGSTQIKWYYDFAKVSTSVFEIRKFFSAGGGAYTLQQTIDLTIPEEIYWEFDGIVQTVNTGGNKYINFELEIVVSNSSSLGATTRQIWYYTDQGSSGVSSLETYREQAWLLGASNNYNPYLFFREVHTTTQYNTEKTYLPKLIGNAKPIPIPTSDVSGKPYWEYGTLSVSNDYVESIIIGNWTVDYNHVKLIADTNKFYYDTDSINPSDLGNWDINNWMRDLFVAILNAILFFLQWIMYLVTIAFQILVVIPISVIAVIFNEYIIYYLLLGMLWIIWYLWVAILWLWDNVIYPVVLWAWDSIVWLWENVIYPFLLWLWQDIILPIWNWIFDNVIVPIWNWIVWAWDWFWSDGIKIVINVIYGLISILITAIVWALSLGNIDFIETYNAIFEFESNLGNGISEIGLVFFTNLPIFIANVIFYIEILGFLVIKLLYCKSRGYYNRVNSIQEAINVYKYPIDIIYSAAKSIWDTLPMV